MIRDLDVHDRASYTQVRLENLRDRALKILPINGPLSVLLEDVLVLPPEVEVEGRHVADVSTQRL